MKPTLDEMCKFMARQLVFTLNEKEMRMYESIHLRLWKELWRRERSNRKRRKGIGQTQ